MLSANSTGDFGAAVSTVCFDWAVKLYTYPIIIARERVKYYAYSEDFPGVYGLGKTIDEARASILDAMRIYIRECRTRRRPIPRARTLYAETVSLSV